MDKKIKEMQLPELRDLVEDIFDLGLQYHPDSMEADFIRISWMALSMLDDYLCNRR